MQISFVVYGSEALEPTLKTGKTSNIIANLTMTGEASGVSSAQALPPPRHSEGSFLFSSASRNPQGARPALLRVVGGITLHCANLAAYAPQKGS